MTANGWLQIAMFFLVVLALTKPLGVYMYRVFEGGDPPLKRLFGPIERLLYRLCGVDPKHEQGWQMYAFSLLIFSLLGLVVTYALERTQQLPLFNFFNPQKLGPVATDLAFNTAASFTTNTNWQAVYGRDHHELSDADGRPGLAQFHLRRRRHRRGPGHGPRIYPQPQARPAADDRQLLGRPGAIDRSTCSCRSAW